MIDFQQRAIPRTFAIFYRTALHGVAPRRKCESISKSVHKVDCRKTLERRTMTDREIKPATWRVDHDSTQDTAQANWILEADQQEAPGGSSRQGFPGSSLRFCERGVRPASAGHASAPRRLGYAEGGEGLGGLPAHARSLRRPSRLRGVLDVPPTQAARGTSHRPTKR